MHVHLCARFTTDKFLKQNDGPLCVKLNYGLQIMLLPSVAFFAVYLKCIVYCLYVF